MGMDQRFYAVEERRNPQRTTTLLTEIFHFRGIEIYHAIGEWIGYGLNGAYTPIYRDDLDALIKDVHPDDAVIGAFGWMGAGDLLREVRKHVKNEDDYVLYEWDN